MADEPIRKDGPKEGESGAQEAEVPAVKDEGMIKETKETAPEIPGVLPLLPVRSRPNIRRGSTRSAMRSRYPSNRRRVITSYSIHYTKLYEALTSFRSIGAQGP